MSDLFSNISHKEPEKWINEIVKENNLKNAIEVNTLTNSAINRLRDQGKEVTQTESGFVIKY